MFGLARRPAVRIETERMYLRPPERRDHPAWARLRQEGRDFLRAWEPAWAPDHLSPAAFRHRVAWARSAIASDRALPLFLFRRADDALLGAITLDNIRRGPAQAASVGYWIGAAHARQGYMTEALTALVHHAFTQMGLSRIEAACLPENRASRGLLERVGFKYEGVAQAYLQIDGRWRNHVLYACLRHDRRGATDAR
ncbi:MAG: GCN5 family N-acetyltransferase [Paracoccaceae bacterium]|nr:MAG: N-acetyltransferase [Alphaproteobacteria bacterium]GIX15638.1 MAG: GCN5 family N-acetyltransferase [Paracoccaceae bacterium]